MTGSAAAEDSEAWLSAAEAIIAGADPGKLLIGAEICVSLLNRYHDGDIDEAGLHAGLTDLQHVTRAALRPDDPDDDSHDRAAALAWASGFMAGIAVQRLLDARRGGG